MCIEDGREAVLIEAYKGYRNIRLIRYWPSSYKWEVEIIESGKRLFVFSDEFELNLS